MASPFRASFSLGSFHIENDLAPLIHMIKAMSLKLSDKARTRLAWMDAYRETGNAAQVCRHFSIPLRTFWRWKDRYDPWELKSLDDRRRGPRKSPRRTSWEVERAVIALKQAHPRWGKEKLALVLNRNGIAISGKTCWRICRRHSLIVRYRTRKRRVPKPRLNWALVRAPGDLVQLDTKVVIFHGRRLYQYTAIDVVSRFRYAEIHRRCNTATAVKFLGNLRRRASFEVHMIQSDNGKEFGKRLSWWCAARRIRHVFSHARRPQENAYVERSHRTDEEEFWSYGAPGATIADLRSHFAKYLLMTNIERPHWGLGGKTPQEALATYSLKEPCHMS